MPLEFECLLDNSQCCERIGLWLSALRSFLRFRRSLDYMFFVLVGVSGDMIELVRLLLFGASKSLEGDVDFIGTHVKR